MTSVSKKIYIDELDDIFNKYNNTYYNTIKMKPVDVISVCWCKIINIWEFPDTLKIKEKKSFITQSVNPN